MAKQPKILKRVTLDEIQIGGSHYVLCYEQLKRGMARAAIYHRAWSDITNRLHSPLIWKSRPRKAEPLPTGPSWWGTNHARIGRKHLYGIAAKLIAETTTVFRIRGGWQDEWDEDKCGIPTADSINGWRRRSLELLKMHLGDWENEAA